MLFTQLQSSVPVRLHLPLMYYLPPEGPVEPSPSRYTYPARFHAYCDGTRILERQPPTAEQPKNVIKHVKNVENFGNFISTLGILK